MILGLTNGTRPKLRNSPDPAHSKAPVRPPPPAPPVGGEAEAAVRNHRMKWGSQGEAAVAGAQRLPPLPKNLIKNQAAPATPPLSSSHGKKSVKNLFSCIVLVLKKNQLEILN